MGAVHWMTLQRSKESTKFGCCNVCEHRTDPEVCEDCRDADEFEVDPEAVEDLEFA